MNTVLLGTLYEIFKDETEAGNYSHMNDFLTDIIDICAFIMRRHTDWEGDIVDLTHLMNKIVLINAIESGDYKIVAEEV